MRFLESAAVYFLFNYRFEQSIPSKVKNKSLLIGTRNSFHANFVGKCQRSLLRLTARSSLNSGDTAL